MNTGALPASIHDSFPDLDAVGQKLHPESTVERIGIEEYEVSLAINGRLTEVVAESIEKAKTVRESATAVVYIAGPLTGVSDEMKARYGYASELLATYSPLEDEKQAFFGYVPHLHGTDPVKHPNVTGDEVRDIDFLWAGVMADLHLNFLKPTAHGNAIELGWAESRLIPSINLNPESNKLSRLTMGMHNVAKLVQYEDFLPGPVAEDKTAVAAIAGVLERDHSGLSGVKLAFDEVHAWSRTFPGRDPREFHYMSFYNLANPTLRLSGQETADGYDIDEVMEKFGKENLLAYVKSPDHKHYGKVGHINFASDYKGVGLVTEDGYPFMFDPLSVDDNLNFWPIGSEVWHGLLPEMKGWDTLLEDPIFDPADFYGREYDE